MIQSENSEYVAHSHLKTTTERRLRQQRLTEFRTARRQEASPVREMSRRNTISIHKAKQLLEEKNRSKALSVREKEYYLTLKLSRREESKKSLAEQNHFGKVLQEVKRKRSVLVPMGLCRPGTTNSSPSSTRPPGSSSGPARRPRPSCSGSTSSCASPAGRASGPNAHFSPLKEKTSDTSY